ncbi:MAG: hypothetical protein WC768_05385, partial [Patescibacteria group bacterium]
AVFLISVFGPHLHWSSQPVRETMGLFFFPVIIYLFDREIFREKNKTSTASRVINKILLVLSVVLIILSHHWSSLMALIWLLFYTLFFVKSLKKRFYSLFLIFVFSLLTVVYWYWGFPQGIYLVAELIKFLSGINLGLVLFLAAGLYFLKTINWDKIKSNKFSPIILLLILSPGLVLAGKLAPLQYPFQLWLMFAIFFIFIFVGFFYAKDKNTVKLALVNSCYLVFWVIALLYQGQKKVIWAMPFDPFRTLEYLIFALAPAGAAGLLVIREKLKIKYLLPIIFASLIFLATLTYPPIFVYKNNFAGTIFYDVRSNIRYIPSEVFELISWANSAGYRVYSIIPEIRSYQETFYSGLDKKNIMLVINDSAIINNYSYIHDPILKVYNPTTWLKNIDQSNIIYRNEAGYLAKPANDAKFIAQNIPAKLKAGQPATFTVILENIGTATWQPAGKYNLSLFETVNGKLWRIKNRNLTKPISPGETITFEMTAWAPEALGDYNLQFCLYQPEIEWFGEVTPIVKVTVEK